MRGHQRWGQESVSRTTQESILTTKKSPRAANLAFRATSKPSFFSITFWETKSPRDMTAPVMKKVWVSFQIFDRDPDMTVILCVFCCCFLNKKMFPWFWWRSKQRHVSQLCCQSWVCQSWVCQLSCCWWSWVIFWRFTKVCMMTTLFVVKDKLQMFQNERG